MQSLEKLLDKQTELNSKLKKKFKQEIDTLQSDSLEFRELYAKQMKVVIDNMESVMARNINTCEETFQTFYEYGRHKSESEFKIVKSFKSDFEKMSIIDSFNDYIDQEIPQFDPTWLTTDFGSGVNSDPGQHLLDKINEHIEITFKKKATMHLPDLQMSFSEPKRSMMNPRQSMKLL